MLEVRGIDIAYGAFAVLHKVDIAVGERRIVGLFGHNGAGKSSLLKVSTACFPCARDK